MAKMKPKKADLVLRDYVLQGAPHTEGGVTYEAGEVITTNRDLVAAFPGKFAPAVVMVPVTRPVPEPEPEDEEEEEATTPPTEPAEDLPADKGTDVSSDFLTAAAKSVTVWLKDDVYSVCDAESGDELAADLTKPAVKKFLKDLHR